MRVDLSIPFRVFVFVWLLAVFLHQLKLTNNIVDQNLSSWVLLISCMLVFFILTYGVRPYDKNFLGKLCRSGLGVRSIKFDKGLFIFWFFGSVVDILYSGGVPAIWIFVSAGKDYTEFGIPSFHGLVNAAYLFLITSLFLKYLLTGEKRFLWYFWLFLIWPVLMLGRGILLSALVQCLAVFLMVRRIRYSTIIYLIALTVVFIVVFGELGNFRSGGNVLGYLIPSGGLMEMLPDGFLWVYIYITTGVNNIFYSYPTLDYIGFPFFSILNLVPSAIKNLFGSFVLNESLVQLVDENLNTSTFLSGYVSDFGYFGGILGSTILAIAARVTYGNARGGAFGSVLGYSVIYQCLIFSPFYDMFFLLPTLFQLVLAAMYSYSCRGALQSSNASGTSIVER